MRTIFATIATTGFQNRWQNSHKVDYVGFVNSFKKYHPDCELITLDENDLKAFGVGLLDCKGTIGKTLKLKYPDANICVIDCDHIIFAPMTEILAVDYDIAAPENYNITGNNVDQRIISGHVSNQSANVFIDAKDYLQGGLIASPSLKFWEHYEYCTQKHYHKFGCYENDTFNIVAYTYPYRVRMLEHNRLIYYGCSILGKEGNCFVKDDRLMCEGSQVKAYHFAHGSAKRKYSEIFPAETHSFIESIIG